MRAVFAHGHAMVAFSGDLSGYVFENGQCELAPKDVEAAERILGRFYDAQFVADQAEADALQAEPAESKKKAKAEKKAEE